MSFSFHRLAFAVAGVFFTFTSVVIILLHFLRGPRRESDYLVIGSVATLASLIVLFAALYTTVAKGTHPFYKVKRVRPAQDSLTT